MLVHLKVCSHCLTLSFVCHYSSGRAGTVMLCVLVGHAIWPDHSLLSMLHGPHAK